VPVRLPGLDPERRYRVRVALPIGADAVGEREPVPWAADGVELSGRALAVLGLPMPILHPERALVITAEATD